MASASRIAAILAALTLAAVAPPASAQPTPAVPSLRSATAVQPERSAVVTLPDGVLSAPGKALQAYEAGLDARARGDTRAALLAFEQAVMLNPAFAGAWFDYGIALCDAGDPTGCRNILDQAIAQFGLPPALHQAAWSTVASHRGELRVGVGASSNLLRATSAESLTLVLDGNAIEALLDNRYRKRGGGFAETAFSWQSVWPLQNITARIELLGRRPFVAELPDFTSGYGEVGLGLRPRTRVGVLALGVDEGYLGALASAGVWAEHQFAPQGVVVRGTVERRRPRDQDGWTTTRLIGRMPLLADTVASAAWEYDFPQENRAGEAQQRFALDLRSGFSLPETAGRIPRLTLGAGVLHARDSEVYSPLFGEVRNRKTRLQLTADLAVNLDRNWRVNLGLLAARQRASIDLFDYNELSAMLSLSYLFE